MKSYFPAKNEQIPVPILPLQDPLYTGLQDHSQYVQYVRKKYR